MLFVIDALYVLSLTSSELCIQYMDSPTVIFPAYYLNPDNIMMDLDVPKGFCQRAPLLIKKGATTHLHREATSMARAS